ncbi:hypothetical protein ACFC00_40170 [Streptomyces adustus]|uniref:hypothetical protein n=1 Tax=Streptomyces adustus TaxID=1609272 RepID=UPI0035DA393D
MKSEKLAERFLLSALEAPGNMLGPSRLRATLDRAGIDEGDRERTVAWLRRNRYVSIDRTLGALLIDVIMLGPRGREHAEHLYRTSRSKIDRELHLHNVLVRWAYDHSPVGGSVSLQMFAVDDDWWFCGTAVTWDEVFAAVDYLASKGLLSVERTNGDQRIRPTALGGDFARSRQMLRTFMSSQQPQPSNVTTNYRDSVVVHGNASGSNLAAGDNNTQTINHGVDADALASLITQLRAVAPTLDLPQEDAEDLTEEVDALEREGAEPRRGRRIWRSIVRILAPAAASAIAADAEEAVHAAIAAGTELFS